MKPGMLHAPLHAHKATPTTAYGARPKADPQTRTDTTTGSAPTASTKPAPSARACAGAYITSASAEPNGDR